jgi:hypothetical protein
VFGDFYLGFGGAGYFDFGDIVIFRVPRKADEFAKM